MVCRFIVIRAKISIFYRNIIANLPICMELQEDSDQKMLNKVGGLILSDLKTHCKATILEQRCTDV